MSAVVLGTLLPFFGTVFGAASVLFLKCGFSGKAQKILSGFAGGVMVAASVWSLLIPAINMSRESGGGSLAFVPAVTGFLVGIFFLFLLDKIISKATVYGTGKEASACKAEIDNTLRRSAMVLLAVTLHNIPEGMAVGAVFAGILADQEMVSLTGAFILSIGITIQNIPEGAIISMPVYAAGTGKKKAFLYGILSGAVEPVGALLTIVLSRYLIPVMPYLLSFAAGAMIYVVVEELIPEAAREEQSSVTAMGFAIGFALMMALDVALG